MFSLDVNTQAGISTRYPRRRQRTGSDDSVALRHHPKRLKRSVLSAETFKPLPGKKVNGHTNHVESASTLNGHAVEGRSHRDVSVDTGSLAIRSKGSKRIEREKRLGKTDGSVELVGFQDSNYDLIRRS